MPYRTALHVDYGVVPIFALRGCRQAEDVPSLYLLHHLLKSECRQMVALINNDLPVLGDEVFDSLFAVGTLDDGDIHGATTFAFPASNLAD